MKNRSCKDSGHYVEHRKAVASRNLLGDQIVSIVCISCCEIIKTIEIEAGKDLSVMVVKEE